jgi:hypothetical protein
MDANNDVFETQNFQVAPTSASINFLRRLREIHVDFRSVASFVYSAF